MNRRKVVWEVTEYVPAFNKDGIKVGLKDNGKKQYKGYFLQFGLETYDESYPTTCALVEDLEGRVHSLEINEFQFKEWEGEEIE